MLDIHTNYSKEFNEYLIRKIKADLTQSAFLFNPIFLYRGKKYTLKQCIDSLTVKKKVIQFDLVLPIKHLIYNNRQLFWLETMLFYKRYLNREYLIWKGKMANLKTMSEKIW